MRKKFTRMRYFSAAFAATVGLLLLLCIPIMMNVSPVKKASETLRNVTYGRIDNTIEIDYQKTAADRLNIAVVVTKRDVPILLYLIGMDPVNERMPVMALPLDTFVTDDEGTKTLLQRYTAQGMTGIQKGLESLFEIEVGRAAQIAHDKLTEVFNFIGSVEYTVPRVLEYENPETGEYINIPKGTQKLDGERILSLTTFPEFEEGESHLYKVQTDVIVKYLDQRINRWMVDYMEEVFKYAVNRMITNINYNDFNKYKNALTYLASLDADIGVGVFVEGTFGSVGFSISEDSIILGNKYFGWEAEG